LRIDPENPPESLAGPMPDFGPFDSSWDALLAACPLILSQPRATAGHRGDMNFGARWKASTEYCAWLYYTPDDKFEMSMLVESTATIPPDEQDERGCRMPAFVDDKRYPLRSLKHVYVLHNHPAVPTHLSEKDIAAIVNVARIHGGFIETKEGKIPVGVVAFFSNSYASSPTTCDGFFEYGMGSNEVVKWTPGEQGKWRRENAGSVTWISKTRFRFDPK
jgi:proteasome lid subunit RPN8/RPN11